MSEIDRIRMAIREALRKTQAQARVVQSENLIEHYKEREAISHLDGYVSPAQAHEEATRSCDKHYIVIRLD